MTESGTIADLQISESRLFPWWLLLLWGVLTIVIGLAFLLSPAVTTIMFVTFLGAYWLVGGIFVLAGLAVDRTNMALKLLLASVNVLAGLLILLHPIYSTIFAIEFLVLFLGFWACFIGAVHLYHAFSSKDTGNGILGAISIVFGILLLLHSVAVVVILPFVAGGFCMISGLTTMYVAYVAKNAWRDIS
jgi:uncharacterized membrane protein HdeD (DUF308 family)